MDKAADCTTESTNTGEENNNPTDKTSLLNTSSSDEDGDVFKGSESKHDSTKDSTLHNCTEVDIHEHEADTDCDNTHLLLNHEHCSPSAEETGTNDDAVEMRHLHSNGEDEKREDTSPRYTKHFHPSDLRRKWQQAKSVAINSRSFSTDSDDVENVSGSPTRNSRNPSTCVTVDEDLELINHNQRPSECLSDNTDDEVVKRRQSRRRRFFSETRGFSTVTRQFSLFMDKDFRYYFQHPYFRLFLVYFAVVCSYLNYALDPVVHSILESSIPLIGNDVSFIGTRYPPGARCVLKVALWIIGLVSGLLIGKYFLHGFIFNRVIRLKMFNNSRGSWMMMMLSSTVLIFVCSLIYNGFLTLGGVGMDQFTITSHMGMSNAFFMKFSACVSLSGDFFTAWLIAYVMLTETLYPGWAITTRLWYKPIRNRIISFLLLVVVPSAIFIFLVLTQLTHADKYVREYIPSDEVSRAFLASFLLVIDLLVIMQDWDFPHFPQPIEVPLDIPILNNECCKISISGKWFKYGVLLLIMILDLNMWKNQIFYTPYEYGQYTDEGGGIYAVTSLYVIENTDESKLSFEYRNTTLDHWTEKPLIHSDVFIYSKYSEHSMGVKLLAFLPSIVTLCIYAILTWKFGRFKPTKEDPYAGRLKKRFKDTLSNLRIPDELRRKIQVVSAFMSFRKSSETDAESDDVINGCVVPLRDVN